MQDVLTYCTQCGKRVFPYAPSSAEPGGERSYWCPHCQRQWTALDPSLTGQLCATCNRLVPFALRYCGYCGNAAGATGAATPDAGAPSLAEGKPLIRRIARVLSVISDLPGRRDRPRAGDLEGGYDFWFDGGAAIHHTGPSRQYDFADGTAAWESTKFGFGVRIRFPDGCEVTVSLTRASRPEEVDWSKPTKTGETH
jgi:hypothetical protein